MHLRHWLLSGSLALLTACAQLPAPPAPPTPTAEAELTRTIARHRQLAMQYQQAGDLAAAAAQRQILTLLSPDETYKRELAATRAAIDRIVKEQLQTGMTAIRGGDTDRATQALLKVLAVDPHNATAAKALRDVEKQKLAGIQAQRAARARQEETAAAENRTPPRPPPSQPVAEPGNGYDIEQGLEMFRAGDVAGGLRELRRYVEANPSNAAARQRIGAVVYARGQDLEREGAREQALTLYEQAIQLRGEAAPGWDARVKALRSALSEDYYQKGLRTYRDDVASAIKQWEASLHFDPNNVKAAARLREARQIQDNLKRIPQQ